MSKVTLTFNIPEEREEMQYALHGVEYSIVLSDLDNWLRAMTKYQDIETVEVDKVRDKLRELLSERDLSI
jgi:hypothetical protein